jgi:hypothetical protein
MEFDLPGDESGEDLAAQLAAERTAREKAEAELNRLKAQRAGAAQQSPSATPAGPSAPAGLGDPPAGLYERLSDRSIDWPTLQQEMRQAGFVDGYAR